MTAAFLLLVCGFAAGPAQPDSLREALLAFVREHKKPDGGYGLSGSERSEARTTRDALRIRAALDDPVADAERRDLAQFVAAGSPHDPRLGAEGLALLEIAERVGAPRPEFAPAGAPFNAPFGWLGSEPLQALAARVALQRALGAEIPIQELRAWIQLWRAPAGGFHFPVHEAEIARRATQGDYALMAPPPRLRNTALSLAITDAALWALGEPLSDDDRERLTRALRALYAPSPFGGHGYRPGLPATAEPTLRDTLMAIRLAERFGLDLPRVGLAEFARAHREPGGAFAPTPGAPATLEATREALELLELLGAEIGLETPAGVRPATPARTWPKLRQAIVQIGPDPGTALALAARAGADLIFLKGDGDPRDLVRRAERLAPRMGLSVAVAAAREDHTRALIVPGQGYATHLSEWLYEGHTSLPAFPHGMSAADFFEAGRAAQRTGALLFATAFLDQDLLAPIYRLQPGHDLVTLTWALAEEGDLARAHPFLHDALHHRAALGNHDAHGDPFHWLHRGLRARTLYAAEAPGYAGFVQAVREGHTLAVAHGHTTSIYGPAQLAAVARAQRADWDLGRGAEHPAVWLPEPLAIPVAVDSAEELGFHAGGPAILVRAAERLGDDALPFEVQLEVDGLPLPLALLPAGAREMPALWARVPDRLAEPSAGRVRVLVRAFGRQTEQWLDFRASAATSQRPLPPPIPRPNQLHFRDPAERVHIRTALHPSDLQAGLGLAIARTDLLLASGDHRAVRIAWHGGRVGERIQVHFDGHPIGELRIQGASSAADLPLPRLEPAIAGFGRSLSLRTERRGWQPSFGRPETDLLLRSVELID